MEVITNYGTKKILLDWRDYLQLTRDGFSFTASYDRRGDKWYATCHRRENGKHATYSTARLILGLPKGDKREAEHRDPAKSLDNRRRNLRIATRAQNNCNRRLRKDNTSGYKGVSMFKFGWKAQIMVNKKTLVLGVCKTKEEAYKLYCEAAVKHHGEFANMGRRPGARTKTKVKL